jgi:hypothetical protein
MAAYAAIRWEKVIAFEKMGFGTVAARFKSFKATMLAAAGVKNFDFLEEIHRLGLCQTCRTC